MNEIPIRNALVSVSDKTGLDALCGTLKKYGVAIYSTGGTKRYLESLPVTRGSSPGPSHIDSPIYSIDQLTETVELMEGRVKTLHPKIFGGILARRDVESDLKEAQQHGIPLFELVVVNLYPFQDHLGEGDHEQCPFIDIGGPSLIRAAAKNFEAVTVLSHPDDYARFIEEVTSRNGQTSTAFRKSQASKTFQRTSAYDAMIASEWSADPLPSSLITVPQQRLRYGENPHQEAAWCGRQNWKVLQGKELSYNNLLDAEAALRLVLEFAQPAVVLTKHNNPCGVAESAALPLADIFCAALRADEKSAFGGIVAVNREVDEAAARAMSALFLEVIIAPHFSTQAISVFSSKKNLRLISWPNPPPPKFDVRPALGGWLLQTADREGIPQTKPVTSAVPSPSELEDLYFAWCVCKHVKSNAIVIAKNKTTLGIGAGQMSRVDAVAIALERAKKQLSGKAVLASDGFFPFRDNIDLLKGHRISAIIQPGGSQRDAEVIQACNELNISMVFTGTRHFRH